MKWVCTKINELSHRTGIGNIKLFITVSMVAGTASPMGTMTTPKPAVTTTPAAEPKTATYAGQSLGTHSTH